MPTLASSGLSEQTFVQNLRDALKDAPYPWTEAFNGDGSTKIFPLLKKPVYDSDAFLTVTVGGVTQVLKDARADLSGATDVYVEYDTGVCYFQTAPAAGTGNVVISHYQVQYLDRQLLKALYDGLHQLFNKLFQIKTFNISLQVNVWEYGLPSDFQDPRTKIVKAEWQEIPAATERTHPLYSWEMVGLTQVKIPDSQIFSPGALVRITYEAPYASLSDLEPQAQHLPQLYAKGILLMDQETRRTRYDQGTVQQGEQANPPGTSLMIGREHMMQFDKELERLSRIHNPPTLRSEYTR